MIDRTDNRTPIAQRVTTAIANASARTGVAFDYLMDQARVESGMRPDARATTSSATGLYQFTRQTWLATVKQHGAAHGLAWAADAISAQGDGSYSVADQSVRSAILELRNNPEAAASMAAEFAADNRTHLQTNLGTDPQAVDLYLAHFLGAAGATRFLKAFNENPQQAAAPLFSAAAGANQAIFFGPGGATRSLAEIRDRFAAKLGKSESLPPTRPTFARLQMTSTARQRAPLQLATMDSMPKKLDLDFARTAYRRLSGDAA